MRVSDIIEVAWGLACPGAFAAILSYLVGLWVFGPLHARAIWKAPQTSFRIADIIILLAQLQLVGGLLFAIYAQVERISDSARVGITLGVWLFLGVWWWTGVRMMAKAKIDYSPHRWLFLGLFVPLGYLATLGLIVMPFTALVLLAMIVTMVLNYDLWSFRDNVLPLLGMLALNAGTIGAALATRAFCRKIAARAKDDFAYREGMALGPLLEGAKPSIVREKLPLAAEHEVKFLDGPST